MNKNTWAEHKPHIKIKHITIVMIDEANRHNDKYLNIHRSYQTINKDKFPSLLIYTYNVTNISKIIS